MNLIYTRSVLSVAAATALFLAGFFGAAPARTHDTLLSASPAEGEAITKDVAVVSLTLNEPFIQVTAGDGHGARTGEVAREDATEVTGEYADKRTIDAPEVNGNERSNTSLSLSIGVLGIILAVVVTYFVTRYAKRNRQGLTPHAR